MKHILYTALLGSAILLAPVAARADLLNGDLGAGVSGQVGVSTPILNSDTKINSRTDADVNVRQRDVYTRDSEERQMREHVRSEIDANAGADIYTEQRTRTRLRAPDISPAAGTRNIPPSARVMGGIQGGASYND